MVVSTARPAVPGRYRAPMDDEQEPKAPITDDEQDVEGHAFKWSLEDDGKGGKRPRQGWDPDSPPPGTPTRTNKPETPKGR